MDFMAKIFISLLLIFGFDSCGSLKMSPPKKTESKYDCYGNPDDAKTNYSEVEENLNRQGALRSRKINLESDVGMIEKP